jgi:uncharacterized Tic20 family protein
MYFGEVAMQFVIFLCFVFLEIDVPLLWKVKTDYSKFTTNLGKEMLNTNMIAPS